MRKMKSAWTSGFTLVEILIVVAIVGILTAIALANFANALNRSKQKRTMSDMRTLAIAWEARATDQARYNAAGYSYPSKTVTFANISGALAPTYLKKIPKRDGWRDDFDFSIDPYPWPSANQSTIYAIRSLGRDNQIDQPSGTYADGTTTRFDCDIIFSNGVFMIYPEGVHLEK